MWYVGEANSDTQQPARTHPLLRTGPAAGLLVFFSLLFNWYYLTGDFQADEFFFLNMMRQDPRPYSHVLGFWAVDDIPALTNIWWFTGDSVGAFWRPLPSLVFEAFVKVFGERPFPLHLFSVLVHGFVAGTLFLLVRRLTGRAGLAFAAGLFFVSCEDHSISVGWITTVTDLICVLCIHLALIAQASWLARRRPAALVGALTAMVGAMLSKESAVVAPLALVLMSLLMPRGREETLPARGASWLRSRIIGLWRDRSAWAPQIGLLVAYLVGYALLGFGGVSGGMYVNPFSDPLGYLVHLVGHLPVMWLATLSPVMPSLPMLMPPLLPPMAIVGALVLGACIAALWFARRSALALWAAAVYILALLPQMSTDASERCLYFPMIGASILLAMLLMQIGPIARRARPMIPAGRRFARGAGWAVLTVVLIPGIVLSATYPFVWLPSLDVPRRDVATIVPHVDERIDRVLLLNTPGFFHTIYPPAILEYLVGRPIDVRVLCSLNGIVTVERADERSFIVRADRGGWLTDFFAGMFHTSGWLKPGQVFNKGFLAATIVETTPSGRDALAVRFAVDSGIGAADLLIVRWDGRVFRPIDLAAMPVGETVTLADTSDVWGSMW